MLNQKNLRIVKLKLKMERRSQMRKKRQKKFLKLSGNGILSMRLKLFGCVAKMKLLKENIMIFTKLLQKAVMIQLHILTSLQKVKLTLKLFFIYLKMPLMICSKTTIRRVKLWSFTCVVSLFKKNLKI